MIATVDQEKIVLSVLATTGTGELKTDIVSATIRVFYIDDEIEVEVLGSTSLENISGSNWSYEWTPSSIAAGQYFIEATLIDTTPLTMYLREDLVVLDIATPENVITSQGYIQDDLESISGELDTIRGILSFIQDIESGHWRIVNYQMIFYDEEDNVLATFNLYDENGSPTNTDVMERVPV